MSLCCVGLAFIDDFLEDGLPGLEHAAYVRMAQLTVFAERDVCLQFLNGGRPCILGHVPQVRKRPVVAVAAVNVHESMGKCGGMENLFGGMSEACDFVDLVQKGFCVRPVARLQGLT